MNSGKHEAVGTWIIKDFSRNPSGKHKSELYKCGEESFKLVVNETFNLNSQFAIDIRFESFKSAAKVFNVTLVLQNLYYTQQSHQLTKTVEFSSSKKEERFEFPITRSDIIDTNFWVDDGAISIGYDVSESETQNSVGNSSNLSTLSSNDIWYFPTTSFPCEKQVSNPLTFEDLTYQISFTTKRTQQIEFCFECESIQIPPSRPAYYFQFNIFLGDYFTDERVRTYRFEKDGDKFHFEIYVSENLLRNIQPNGAYLKIRCNIDQNLPFPAQVTPTYQSEDLVESNKINNYPTAIDTYPQNTTHYYDNATTTYYNQNTTTTYYNQNTTTTYYNTAQEDTGYAGLWNQGATCYMNSMLQSLFHIPAFRKIVYEMQTTGTEDVTKSIPLSLQNLFVAMQLSKSACSTKALTTSFGWDDAQTIVQHDVQEFCRVLLDNLEEKLKNTPLDGQIANLFRGKFRSFIRAVNVDFESSKEEYFYDLSMVVKDTPDLASSFRKYIETELLDGDNQYSTEQYGKQDVRMGTEFVQFPKVLHLHLRRFEYDFSYDRMEKINSRFEFPATFDLSEFLAQNADRSKSYVYDLYGVLVHSGSTAGGHYYAFLRTSTDPQWYKFDDSRVTRATEQEAIDENFGGSSTQNATYGYQTGYYHNSYYNYDRCYSAYMLVYVRRDSAEEIFTPIQENTIPDHLRQYFHAHQDEIESSTTYSSTKLNAKIIPEDALIANAIGGKSEFECPELQKKFTVAKDKVTYKQFYEMVAKQFNYDPEEIRILQSYQKFVPYSVVPYKDELASQLWYDMYFVQKKPREEQLEVDTQRNILISMKFFDPSLEVPLQYLGSHLFDKSQDLEALFAVVIAKLGLPPQYEQHLKIYDESTSTVSEVANIYPLRNSYTVMKLLVFQLTTPPEENRQILAQSSFPFAKKADLASILSKYSQNEEKEDETKEEDQERAKKEASQQNADDDEDEVEKFKELTKYLYTDYFPQPNCESYINYIESQKEPIKAIAYDYNDPQSPPLGFVEFPSNLTLDQLKEFVTTIFHLNYNPLTDLLLLYRKAYNGTGTYPYALTGSSNLSVEFTNYSTSSKTVYQRLFIRLIPNLDEATFKDMITYPVSVSEDGYVVSKEVKLLLRRNPQARDAINKLQEMNCLTEGQLNDPDSYRLYSIFDHCIDTVYTSLDTALPYYETQIRLDLIPEDQRNLDSDRFFLITSAHVTQERHYKSFYGEPFYFLIDKEESYDDFVNRLKEKVHLSADMKFKVLISDDKHNLNQKHSLKAGTQTIGEQIQGFNLVNPPMMFIFNPKASKSAQTDEVKIYN